ncbi:DNA-binding protein [Jiangella ureilytica]|uniref:DNA-binding protein n=1 Tax=Jiangella ureilytica TaxID=2530374 RepID=A0A4R4RPL8_9ACTN|nr:helix-turn-helix domain-containing protein [Jiangella ureilytica]TDC51089.1 DNA-binding protein [Jiangella ureilytica]
MAKIDRSHTSAGRNAGAPDRAGTTAKKAMSSRTVVAKSVAGRRLTSRSVTRSTTVARSAPATAPGKELSPEASPDLQRTIAKLRRLPDVSQPLGPEGRAAARVLDELLSGHGDVYISASGGPDLKLPAAFHHALRRIVDLASNGRPAVLIFTSADDPDEVEIEPAVPVELTSQQAADLLNVSRPHVVKLARTGELPHRMVGNRHRFHLEDVLEYEQRQRRVRDQALAAIAPEDGYTAEDF